MTYVYLHFSFGKLGFAKSLDDVIKFSIMLIKGKAHKFGDNIDTDIIIPARYLITTDVKELGTHCMEGVDTEFPRKVSPGDIIVAGENFGCGSSREHAPLSIKGCGIFLVIASSFARIFLRNSINVGLPIVISEDISRETEEGDELEVDLGKGRVRNLTKDTTFKIDPFPQFLHQIISSGGLMEWYKISWKKR